MPSLSPTARRIADVVAEDPGRVASGTISDLAGRCSTSETTVVRFCRALGFGGYSDFRVALAMTVGQAGARYGGAQIGPDITPSDKASDVIAKIASADARAIEDTGAQLDPAVLDRVAARVAAARQVDLYGVGASAIVAMDLQQKLHRVGHTVFAFADPNVAMVSASLRRPGDVAIAISHTGASVDTVACLREAQSRGATTVAVTNFPRSPVTKFADLVLTTAARETTYRSGAMSSRIAALTVVDCLFVAVAQKQRKKVTEALERTRASAVARHVPEAPTAKRQRGKASK